MKILFLGTPQFAAPTLQRLHQSSHTVIAVVTQPDRPRGRGQRTMPSRIKQLAESYGITVLQPENLKDSKIAGQLAALNADLGVVVAYGKILPQKLLNVPHMGMLNVHASLLPKYRGAAPIQRATIAGEKETGITIIKLVREMDAGPILLTRTRPLGPDETSDDIEGDLATIGADVLIEAINALQQGKVSLREQDHEQATLAPRLTKRDGAINWNAPATEIHNQVRGLHPWPHAYTYLEKHRYVILRTSVKESTTSSSTLDRARPGTVIEARGEILDVEAGLGTVIRILEIQPEGKRRQSAQAFLAGHHITIGTTCHGEP